MYLIADHFGPCHSTGSGRESGGDSWKQVSPIFHMLSETKADVERSTSLQYCRWHTATINWSNEVGMAQGVVFE